MANKFSLSWKQQELAEVIQTQPLLQQLLVEMDLKEKKEQKKRKRELIPANYLPQIAHKIGCSPIARLVSSLCASYLLPRWSFPAAPTPCADSAPCAETTRFSCCCVTNAGFHGRGSHC